jgi:hypothetical protein
MLLTLLSNQGAPPTPTKTFWVKINGVWKQAIAYVKIAGTWKTATPYINIAGVWK